jgi:hypothetical protein
VIKGLALGLVVGALFLGLALWGVPLDQVGDAIANVDGWWLAAALALLLIQYELRAWRQLLLVQPLAPATTFRTQVAITLVGFFCVNTFPARLGEVVRPYLMYERDRVPIGAGIGVVFVERIIDFAALDRTAAGGGRRRSARAQHRAVRSRHPGGGVGAWHGDPAVAAADRGRRCARGLRVARARAGRAHRGGDRIARGGAMGEARPARRAAFRGRLRRRRREPARAVVSS